MKQPTTHEIDILKLTAEFQLTNGNSVKRVFVGRAIWNTTYHRIDHSDATKAFNDFLKWSNSTGLLNIEPNIFVPYSFVHRVVTVIEPNKVTVTEQ